MSFDTISVIGLGYIGLPTAAVFAARKINVIGVDVNEHAVNTINQGKIHIVEPDLDMVVHAAVTEGYLRATTIPEAADAFLIAVPTPFKGDHEPDLRFIEMAIKSISSVIKKGDLIILESTSPVGATEKMAQWLREARPDLKVPIKENDEADVNVAHCPERVLPGRVMHELIENDRVIGGITPKCSIRASQLYKIFVQGECVITNARTAEMAKLTENSFRDVNIAFANELSMICEKLDINVWELIPLANRHPRVNILQPGPGVGGHCIAVDPWFIVNSARDEAKLIYSARIVNDHKPYWVVEKLKEAIAGIDCPIISCLGLAFKADIDDLRESPAVEIVSHLASIKSIQLLVSEPHIDKLPDHLDNLENLKLVDTDEAVERSDVVLLLVDHKEFTELASSQLKDKKLIDTRGIFRS